MLRSEQTAPAIRVQAADSLSTRGDADVVGYALDLYVRTLADPTWAGGRRNLARIVARSSSADARAAFRAALRSKALPGADLTVPFEMLLGSDAVEDRIATVDFFRDESRFGKIPAPSGPLLAPLMSDLLEDDDPLVRKRVCTRLVGDEPQARQFKADLWDEVHGYPCARLQRASVRAQVAASIRGALGLGPARPPLPQSALSAPVAGDLPPQAQSSVEELDDYFDDVRALAVSPDATVALTAGRLQADEWLLGTHRHLYYLGGSGNSALAFVPTEPVAIVWSGKYGAKAFDAETGEGVQAFPPCAMGAPPPPPAILAGPA